MSLLVPSPPPAPATSTRRDFLAEVGRGMVTATVGLSMASELGFASSVDISLPPRLEFGELEPLVQIMQETPVTKLLPLLVGKLRKGVSLQQLVAAGAYANARTFGGEDYVGFHTMMAIAPGFHMARELAPERAPLPVLKVLYRNTSRIQEFGGIRNEVLRPTQLDSSGAKPSGDEWLRDSVRGPNRSQTDQLFAASGLSPEEMINAVLPMVDDETEVHRVVLPYRAWDLLGLIGREHAGTLLRQSVRYCVKSEMTHPDSRNESRRLLPQLLEEHQLLGAKPGDRTVDDQWITEFSALLFKSTPSQAAAAAAAALAEGIAPDAIGEAISLTANQLLLRDHGRTPSMEVTGKPIGSVHGDSIGVHACDSAAAWRNLARVANPRNTFACLILGAYQAALDRTARGGDFQNWAPLPLQQHSDSSKLVDSAGLLRELDEAIRGNLQGRAAGIVHRYGQLTHDPANVFEVLRSYAISEDGALHGEKFFRTVTEEFRTTRPIFRWRHLIALARVTASEYGRPGAGVAEAIDLLRA